MSYELTQEKLSKANKKLLKDIHAHLDITKKDLSNTQLMEMLNQAFFSKPSGEVNKTILQKSKLAVDWGTNTYDVDKTKEVAKVQILHYGVQKVVTLNGEYYRALNLNLDDEISLDELKNIANQLAIVNKSYVKEVFLPEILDKFDEEDENNIINIASEMGYFDYPETIYDLIEDSNTVVSINGGITKDTLDGEWMSEIVSEFDEDSDITDHVIWHPEIGNNLSHDFMEHYITMKELNSAKKRSDGSWFINSDIEKNKLVVEFFKRA